MKNVTTVFTSLIILFLSTLADTKAENVSNKIESLISTSWLSENLENDNLIILHVGRPDEYKKEHIPGSRIISLMSLIVNTEKLSHEFPEESVIDSVLKSWGINKNSRIVISYESDMMVPPAARLYVTLDYAGLGDKTSVLDGGLQKWKEDGYPVTESISEFTEGNYDISINKNVLVDSEWILGNLRNSDVVIIDSRPEEEYAGKEEESHRPRPGHIEGAINLPFFKLNDEDQPYQFKSAEELIELFGEKGIKKGGTVVTYCGTGIWACPFYVAAKRLGYNVKFYDGSFEEWSNNEKLPITGPVNIQETD